MERMTSAQQRPGDETRGVAWREVLRSGVRHRRMVITFAAVAALIMGGGKFLEAPQYEAEAALRLVSTRADVKVSPEERSAPQVERVDEMLVNSEAAWLRSEAVLRDVLEPKRAKADVDGGQHSELAALIRLPLALPGIVYRYLHGAPEPSAFESWVDSVRTRLSVDTAPRSDIIELSYRDGDPVFAADLVNSLIAYRMKRQASFSQQDQAVVFYDAQSGLLAERVRQAEDALQAFYEREGIIGGPEERKVLRDRLAEIHMSVARAGTELAETRVRADFLERSLRQLPRRMRTDAAGSMQSRILELMLERSKLLATYAPSSVKIIDLDMQIAEAKRLVREEKNLIADAAATANPTYLDIEKQLIEARAQAVSLETRTAALTSEERGYREQMRKLVSATSTLDQLETDLDRAKEARRTYVGKREDARFATALDSSEILNITVTEPATVPAAPVSARIWANFALGAVAGMFAGIALAYVRDLINPTVKSAVEAGRLTGMPILGEVSP